MSCDVDMFCDDMFFDVIPKFRKSTSTDVSNYRQTMPHFSTHAEWAMNAVTVFIKLY